MSEQQHKGQDKKKGSREFGPSSMAVNNRTTIYVLTLIILLGGLFSYQNMPRENFPEIVIPTIYVGTTYPGNSPVDIENLITRPIEKEINTVSGIKEINSTSVQDYSTIIVEFNPDIEVSRALQDVKDAVDKSKSELPSDLDKDPNVFEMDFSEFPIMNINLAGDFEMDYLKDYAEYLEDEIEALPEISEVDIKGAKDREVRIDVDIYKMNAAGVSFNDIETAIARENVTISGGDVEINGEARSLRVVGEFKNMDQIKGIIVKAQSGDVVYLRDIADVAFTFEEPESYARAFDFADSSNVANLAGNTVVSLDVKKRSGENLLNAVDKIKVILEEAQQTRFPPNLKVFVTNDQSKQTRSAVSNLENSIISGMILVVLVLLFFMGLRNSMFVGIAIPMSMLMGIAILGLIDVTLNTMVLFSLVLALGMLVDNGIVVVENIYRLMQEGKPPMQAAKEGVGEVAWPIITSTATTLAAFFPLLFWEDIMGEFMKFLPLTLIIVLASSLFVALVINPVLTSAFMKVQSQSKKRKSRRLYFGLGAMAVGAGIFHAARLAAPDLGLLPMMGNFLIILFGVTIINVWVFTPLAFRFQNVFLNRLERWYERLVTFALRGKNPIWFLVGNTLLFIFSIMFLGLRAPKVNFFPVNQPQYVNVFVEMENIGTDIEVTNKMAKDIEKNIYQTLMPYEDIVEAVITNVGEGTSDPMDGSGPNLSVTPHKARITVSFVDFEERGGINTQDVMEEIRDGIDDEGFPGAIISVDKNRDGPPVGKPISIEISGENIAVLDTAVTSPMLKYINNQDIAGIEELKRDLEVGKPEIIVHVNRDMARSYNLSTAQVASTIRTSLYGKELSKYKKGEDDYPIMLRFDEEHRNDLESIMEQKITFRDQNTGKFMDIPISAVASLEYGASYGSIKRKDLDRVVTISSNVSEDANANEINQKLRRLLEDYEMPAGYNYKFGGEQEEQGKTVQFLLIAMTIAVFTIVMIIVAQFNSLSASFIVFASIIFSTIGVFMGIAIFRMEIIILMTGIGIISLAGIVVNNVIVLMDYTELIRKRHREEIGVKRLPMKLIRQSIVEAGKTRLRPVLLTAITTVLGLIPLAVGFNFNFSSFLERWDPQIFIGGDTVVFWAPMAWTVIFGLTFSTFLTLVIVPVMYYSFDSFNHWFAAKMRKVEHEVIEGDDG